MWPDVALSAARDRRLRERAAGLSLALLLQGGFLIMLSLSVLRPSSPAGGIVHDLILVLPRLSQPQPVPRQRAAPPPKVVSAAPVFAPPSISGPPATMSIPPSDDAIRGFGQALNNCAPENYANLPQDQRAKCQPPGAGATIQEFPSLMGAPSQVQDEAHWQDELARKQSPALLPCGGFINIVCFLGKVADGRWIDYGDPSTWPHYAVKQLAPEDFYKIEKAYDAWHKEHSPAANKSASPAGDSPGGLGD